ncbi:Gfo/Idh/MocA family oxidoreductase [Halorubrum gandharaense]
MTPLRVGIIGCGNISGAYFDADAQHDAFEVVACADRSAETAERAAAAHDVESLGVDELLTDDRIDAVVNLTPPTVHASVTRRALRAGNHVYSEKPLATTVSDAEEIRELAAERGLRVGVAPDTFLGRALQTCRTVIDEGRIGTPHGATVVWTSSGHESWHPNPDLFYERGGGPLFDVGPYYLTALVFLLGPVHNVTGAVTQAKDERTIGNGPREGESIPVSVPTHETGTLTFESGAVASVTASFDVQGSSLPAPAFEIYGTEGTLRVPDPNHFDGEVVVVRDNERSTVSKSHTYDSGRGAGVADLARAISSDWEHRTSVALGAHVLETMAGVRESAEREETVEVASSPTQPSPIPQSFPND